MFFVRFSFVLGRGWIYRVWIVYIGLEKMLKERNVLVVFRVYVWSRGCICVCRRYVFFRSFFGGIDVYFLSFID